MSKPCRSLPAPLSRAARRFEEWRAEGRPRRPLPGEFWDLAVELGRKYGLNRTARALRLDYYALKKRLVPPVLSPAVQAPPAIPAAPSFVEVVPALFGAGSECVVEMEAPEKRMKMEMKGALPDLVALGRLFFGAAEA